MKTGNHLKIKSFGTNALGVVLEGNPEKPEPIHFRISLPFGDVDIARCSDNTYWVHVRTDNENDGSHIPGDALGKFIDARIDLTSRHSSGCDAGDFTHPDMYHLAVKIGPK